MIMTRHFKTVGINIYAMWFMYPTIFDYLVILNVSVIFHRIKLNYLTWSFSWLCFKHMFYSNNKFVLLFRCVLYDFRLWERPIGSWGHGPFIHVKRRLTFTAEDVCGFVFFGSWLFVFYYFLRLFFSFNCV